MRQLVITAVGNDRTGVVESLARVVAGQGGNWEQSRMTELAGSFAGVVLISVPDENSAALRHQLEDLNASGMVNLMVELPIDDDPPSGAQVARYRLELVGQDQPGIVHEVSQALARSRVSIEELETEVVPAPMGGHLFQANAIIEVPRKLEVDDLRETLEALAANLMVDIELTAQD